MQSGTQNPNARIVALDVGTKHPLYHDFRDTDFTNKSFHFTDIEKNSLQKFNYVLLSNVSNKFTVNEKEQLKTKWILLQEFDSGQIYLQLFKNPETVR